MDPLLELDGVAGAVRAARTAVDQAYRHPTLRRDGGRVAAEISLRCAVASAALSGSPYDVSAVRSGTVLDPMVHGALRVAEALPGLADRWPRSPRQVLAKLHVLAGTGIVPSESLGRPLPSAAPALGAVCDLVVAGSGDALIRAAIVHGELLAIGAFGPVNGIVARAAARLTLVSSALDPRGLVAAEEIHLSRQPEYVGCANAFATGTQDGLRSWLKHCALAVEQGAMQPTSA